MKTTNEIQYNWSKNIQQSCKTQIEPDNIESIIELIKSNSQKSIRAVGTKHCFNTIADTKSNESLMINLKNLKNHKISKTLIDNEEVDSITIDAGITYSNLIDILKDTSFALANMASLPNINVIGSILTATHGSGYNNPSLSNLICGFKQINQQGDIVEKSINDVDFSNQIMNFGGIGIIISANIKLVPFYTVKKEIYEDLQWDNYLDNQVYQSEMYQFDFCSYFLDWKERKFTSVWAGTKNGTGDNNPDYFGAKLITNDSLHPVPGMKYEACTSKGIGPWQEKLCHFKPDFPPSSAGNEIHSEFFVKFEQLESFLNELYDKKDYFIHLVQITEIRQVKKDSIKLNLSYAKIEDRVGVHFTWFKKHDEILEALKIIEQIVVKFNAQPHFGKLFTLSKDQLNLIMFEDLKIQKDLVKKEDPNGLFRNDWMELQLINE